MEAQLDQGSVRFFFFFFLVSRRTPISSIQGQVDVLALPWHSTPGI